jgi:hypothetical protein
LHFSLLFLVRFNKCIKFTLEILQL